MDTKFINWANMYVVLYLIFKYKLLINLKNQNLFVDHKFKILKFGWVKHLQIVLVIFFQKIGILKIYNECTKKLWNFGFIYECHKTISLKNSFSLHKFQKDFLWWPYLGLKFLKQIHLQIWSTCSSPFNNHMFHKHRKIV
jgi:hypothetical protein